MPVIAPHGLSFDIAHMLAGLLVLVSLMMLYQVRLFALLHVFSHQFAPRYKDLCDNSCGGLGFTP